MNGIGATSILLRQFDGAWQAFRDRIEGLTDEEYLWEPVEGCWTVHVDETGKATVDFTDPAPFPPPFTTIAWRLSHIGQSLMYWADRHFGDGSFSHESLRWPSTANEAITFVEAGRSLWREGLLSVDGSTLDENALGSLLSQANHVRHHGAEVGVMRDLYWETHKRDPFVQACLRGDRVAIDKMREKDPEILQKTISRHPDLAVIAGETSGAGAMSLLLGLGFSGNRIGQRSPLHQAVALDDLDLVRKLVELGADLKAVDTSFRSTPLEWARFFGHSEIIKYLDGLEAQ